MHLLNHLSIEKLKQQQNHLKKFPIDKKLTVIAIIIPKIPKKFPCRDVSGDDKPLMQG